MLSRFGIYLLVLLINRYWSQRSVDAFSFDGRCFILLFRVFIFFLVMYSSCELVSRSMVYYHESVCLQSLWSCGKL